MFVGQSCWTVYLGTGVKVHVPRCLNVLIKKKKTAIRQVAQGEIYPLHSVGVDPYDFPKWEKLGRTICGRGDGGCTFSDI